MHRRNYVRALGATVVAGAFAGCAGNGNGNDSDDGNGDGGDDGNGDDGSETGVLSTSVTDQPNDIADFESLVITIDGIWVKPDEGDDEEGEEGEEIDDDADGNETDGDTGDEMNGDEDEDDEEDVDVDQSAGRRYIEFEEPQDADLVLLQGDESQLIDETQLEVGDYGFLQLDVAGTTGILEADGEEADVETPGNAPLQFQQAFEIRPDERTRFVADFAPFRIGPPNSSRYLIRPVASGTRVIYGDDEGTNDDDTDGDTDGQNADEDGGTESDGDTEADPGTNETEN